MADQRMVSIAQGLLNQTRQGRVNWVETADEYKFSVAYPDSAVSIRRLPEYMGYSYLLSIYNEKGTEVDSLGASDGDQYNTKSP